MRLDWRRSSSAKILEAVLQDLLDCVQAFCTYVAQARKDVSNDIDRMEEKGDMRQARQGGGLVVQEFLKAVLQDLLGCVQGCCTWSRGKKGCEQRHGARAQTAWTGDRPSGRDVDLFCLLFCVDAGD